ncbi:putative glutamate--tRNA ligase, mitochondrial [Hypsibius exemplaris]|uniref:Nondiscriminating glutamyl-tRNA synthetase EARS2, mitochondrial n=1 Tax=Hypsibius exemplaris TaxID=2072580 RepID=A0A1W0X205_HYPEX|nr:putative glutamate--tRNA ligase, mitochondrial [Hypsibius exemplaris]
MEVRIFLSQAARSAPPLLAPSFALVTATKRHQSTQQQPRLRFAPSPTGLLHLGGLRTALYNYLMCRKTGGTFVLRIEDTDRARLVPGAVENIQDSLEWMGLKPDEGPRYGGPFAPYTQSERLDLYKEKAEQLIETGAAYRCYCSPLRLELMRKEAVKRGEQSRYDNRCRSLSSAEQTAKHTAKEPFVIRLKMDPHVYELQDEVYGPTSLRVDQEGDPVLIKSDGFPTYHLANVVDDHEMRITHVLRGIEWQMSTPKHLRLYEALGWKPPLFAHLPLLMNADGSKLSKRKGAQEIMEYKKLGYYPDALVNFLTLAGGGFHRNEPISNRLYRLDEMADNFDLALVNRNSCQLNFPKLEEYNRQAVRLRLNSPPEKAKFLAEVQRVVKEKYGTDVTAAVVRHVVEWAAESRLTNINDLFAADLEFVWVSKPRDEKAGEPFTTETKNLLLRVADSMAGIPDGLFDRSHVQEHLQTVVTEAATDLKKLMHAIRLAVCGVTKGPSVGEMAEILGQREFVRRLRTVGMTPDVNQSIN